MGDYEPQHAVEIVKGFILCGIVNLEEILYLKPDALFPLERLPAWVWRDGYRGEVVYYPIDDYGILPDDVLDLLVDAIVTRLKAGKRVGLFCVGGHGRTGYVAACVLHMLGQKRPIAFLHDKYSEKAVETVEQENAIKRFQERHPVVPKSRKSTVKEITQKNS
ncbi:MAG: hypothetical protein J6Y10_04940 [Lachnospiraceae bacterium]|nr:hypothetical protein [Lachnospiraceae bacterium]